MAGLQEEIAGWQNRRIAGRSCRKAESQEGCRKELHGRDSSRIVRRWMRQAAGTLQEIDTAAIPSCNPFLQSCNPAILQFIVSI
jgi:hypothetical protein